MTCRNNELEVACAGFSDLPILVLARRTYSPDVVLGRVCVFMP